MKNHKMNPKRLLGLTRAWSAYIRMLVHAIIQRQSKISGLVE